VHLGEDRIAIRYLAYPVRSIYRKAFANLRHLRIQKGGLALKELTPLNFLEAATRLELVNNGFADRSLTTWVCRQLELRFYLADIRGHVKEKFRGRSSGVQSPRCPIRSRSGIALIFLASSANRSTLGFERSRHACRMPSVEPVLHEGRTALRTIFLDPSPSVPLE
jgi:hypothetical protein